MFAGGLIQRGANCHKPCTSGEFPPAWESLGISSSSSRLVRDSPGSDLMRLAAGLVLVFAAPVLHAQGPPSYIPPPSPPSTPASVSAFDESTLKNAYLPYTGAALLEFFKKRLDSASGPQQIADLIKKLGDGNEDSRNRAC